MKKMQLYFMEGACSLAPHIVARELGIEIDLIRYDARTKTLGSGEELLTLNPKGYLPVLRFGDGQTLTESPVIMQFLADCNPHHRLIGPLASEARYRVLEWLNFVATELHPRIGALFHPRLTEDRRAELEALATARLDLVEEHLHGKYWLTGEFSLADIYLFVILGWTDLVGLDIARYQKIQSFRRAVAARPAVKQAIAAEASLRTAPHVSAPAAAV